jgi:rfaE bifunctional protein nucleotidyltransferase chain/domain
LFYFYQKEKAMSHLNTINNKIHNLKDLKIQVEKWKQAGNEVVFTNGCFDIIHKGHIEVLARSADLGDKLIIGLNSDQSIQKLKGEDRPIIDEQARAILLASLEFVDAVVIFSEDTPLKLISALLPDVLAKGGDYEIETIVGHEIVQQNGGKVKLVPFVDGFSSTTIIDKIKNS